MNRFPSELHCITK